jgi:hypothetical protein
MPFTFSHPAIVLPLTKINPKYISSSALIMGSMSPDFEYFINMKLGRIHGHTLSGAFYYDLPVTLICLILFHLLVRDTLIDHLPHPLHEKYKHLKKLNWICYFKLRWHVVLYCSLIGIFSHLFWDSFTHAPGFFSSVFPALNESVYVFNTHIKVYYLLQITSSVVGAMAILIAVAWYYPAWKNYALLKLKNWTKTFHYILVVMMVCFSILLIKQAESLNEFVGTSIAGALIGLMVAPILLSKVKKQTDKI